MLSDVFWAEQGAVAREGVSASIPLPLGVPRCFGGDPLAVMCIYGQVRVTRCDWVSAKNPWTVVPSIGPVTVTFGLRFERVYAGTLGSGRPWFVGIGRV